MGKILGLDIGIGSLGWAIVDEDKHRIIDLGVRIFESGEEGASKAADRSSQLRRAKRATRRLNKRNTQRKLALKRELKNIGLITPEEINKAYRTKGFEADIWRYRSEGLSRKLTPIEIASVLINFANYRGYQDFYEDTEEDKEGKLTEAKNKVIRLYEGKKNQYSTIGEMIYKDSFFRNPNNGDLIIRNKGIRDKKTGKKQTDYKYLIDRSYLIDELNILLNTQREFGYSCFAPDVVDCICNIIFHQRDFEDGPGPAKGTKQRNAMNDVLSGSQKYSGFDELIGNCPFYPEEQRGHRNSLLYDMYVLINNLSQLYFYSDSGETITCPVNVIIEVWNKLFDNNGVCSKKDLESLCKENNVHVEFPKELSKKKNIVKANYIAVLTNDIYFPASIQAIFRDELFDDQESLSSKIGYILAKYATPRRRKDELSLILTPDEFKIIYYAKNLKNSKSEGSANVSFKYMKEAVDAYLKGEKYGDFQARINKEFVSEGASLFKNGKLNPISDADMVRNPVVYRSLNEVRKVINAVNAKYKDVSAIHVEVARDIGMSFEQRKEVAKRHQANEINNENVRNRLITKLTAEGYSASLSDKLFEKFVLWESQNGLCMYSGENITFDQLMNSESVQVDHIVPRSIVLDNTLNNKVLVFTKENQKKLNRLPLQYIDENHKKDFINRVNNLNRNGKISKIKKEYLLLAELTDEVISGFVDRNINDTRYISKYIANYLKAAFVDKIAVRVIRGSITSRYRKLWLGGNYKKYGGLPSVYGLEKKTRDLHYYHHAIDAVVLANLTRPYIEIAQDYLKIRDIKRDLDRNANKGNAATVMRLQNDYDDEIANSKEKMKKYYGFNTQYTDKLLTSGYVPSICTNLREEVEVRVPLNIDMDIRKYKEMTDSYRKLKTLLKSVLLNFDETDYTDVDVVRDQVLPDELDTINSLIPIVCDDHIVCMKPNGQIITSDCDISEKKASEIKKELETFYKNLYEKDIKNYIKDISMCSEEEYSQKVHMYYEDNMFSDSIQLPYVSFKISRKFRGSIVASDNPVSLKKTGFKSYKELECDMKSNLKCPYYVRFNKGIGEQSNFTIYDARQYYCVEVFKDEKDVYQARGIRYVDVYKKNNKLYLKKPLPSEYTHEAYLFKNEYIRVLKKGKQVNNGFGAYRGVENINQNTIKMRLYSNKNTKNTDVYIRAYEIKKYEISILGHNAGEITCGDQSLFITENE